MAVLSAYKYLTLAEVNKRAGFTDMAAILGERKLMNDFLDEAVWLPATHGNFNKAFQASRLGKGAFSQVNGPVPLISSTGQEVTEPVKMYEGDSPIDDRILDSAIDPYAARDSEDAMNMEGILQDWTSQLLYANTASVGNNNDAFRGLWSRRTSYTATPKQVIDGGLHSSTAATSMLVCEFGPSAFYLAYPENTGTPPGIANMDRGMVYIPAPTGTGNYWAWVRHYEIWAAIVLRDNRAMIRVSNLNPIFGGTGAFATSAFMKAKNYLPRVGRNAVAFCNRTIHAQIDDLALNKTNNFMSVQEFEGYGPITSIAGIPIRVMEAILETESSTT
jgi:hypothetical protein